MQAWLLCEYLGERVPEIVREAFSYRHSASNAFHLVKR